MVDAWGGWSLFQTLLRTLKKVASKHGVSISTIAVRYILNQVMTSIYVLLILEANNLISVEKKDMHCGRSCRIVI